MHFEKIHYLTVDLDVKVTFKNVAQYPLLHVTYSGTKSEVAMCNGLGGDAFTRKCFILPLTLTLGHTECCPVPSTSCAQFEVATSNSLRRDTFTRNVKDKRTYRQTMDWHWNKIIHLKYPSFLKKKASIIN